MTSHLVVKHLLKNQNLLLNQLNPRLPHPNVLRMLIAPTLLKIHCLLNAALDLVFVKRDSLEVLAYQTNADVTRL